MIKISTRIFHHCLIFVILTLPWVNLSLHVFLTFYSSKNGFEFATTKKKEQNNRKDRKPIEDDELSGRPSTSETDEDINKLWKKVDQSPQTNHQKTGRRLEHCLWNRWGPCMIVNDLDLRRVVAKLVQKGLNFMQKRDRDQRHDFQGLIRPNIHQAHHYWRRDEGLWVRHAIQHQTSMGVSGQLRMNEDQKTVKKESGAHDFYGLQRHCMQRIFAKSSYC